MKKQTQAGETVEITTNIQHNQVWLQLTLAGKSLGSGRRIQELRPAQRGCTHYVEVAGGPKVGLTTKEAETLQAEIDAAQATIPPREPQRVDCYTPAEDVCTGTRREGLYDMSELDPLAKRIG